jgi:hypothetical protein
MRTASVERECLLAAFKVLHGHLANDQGPKSLEIGSLISALIPSRPAVALPEPTAELPPARPALPSPPPPKPYVHPELEAIGYRFGNNTLIVRWAIQRMTEDYTVRDIAALLKREGRALSSAEISVVLTRLKGRGEIDELEQGRGRRAAIFRKPASTIQVDGKAADQVGGGEPTPELSAIVGGETVPTPAAAA